MLKKKERPRCAFFTLGCKVNQYETESLTKDFLNVGFELVDFQELASVYIINTCAVTLKAERKSRQAIGRAKRAVVAPQPSTSPGLVVATGCLVDKDKRKLAQTPGVDLVVSNQDKEQVLEKVLNMLSLSPHILEKEDSPSLSSSRRTRALVKIQDGCDQFCSYCLVPKLRGRPRSRHFKEVLEEIEQLINEGTKEVVLTGIHLGKYGQDLSPPVGLLTLLKEIASIKSDFRIRLSSLEISEIGTDLISFLASSTKICRHLHIPLQSGSDKTLKAMDRSYTHHDYLKVVRRIKETLPEVALTTDVMVGFPQEAEDDFAKTCQTVEEVGFRKIHVFKYSPRPQTKAYKLSDRLSPKILERRSAELCALGERLSREFIKRFVGKELLVLVEQKKDNLLTGLTDNYLRLNFKGLPELKGHLVKVKALEMKNGSLYGKLVKRGTSNRVA